MSRANRRKVKVFRRPNGNSKQVNAPKKQHRPTADAVLRLLFFLSLSLFNQITQQHNIYVVFSLRFNKYWLEEKNSRLPEIEALKPKTSGMLRVENVNALRQMLLAADGRTDKQNHRFVLPDVFVIWIK